MKQDAGYPPDDPLKKYEAQLWSCSNCFCGLCVERCPAYSQLYNEAVSARGLAQIGLSLLCGELEISELSDEILYACTGCRWCETVCSMNTPIYIKTHGKRSTKVSGATMGEILRSMKILQGGKIPIEVRNGLMSLVKYGNPYGSTEVIKDEWVGNLDLASDSSDTVLYVGATVPYDDNSRKMAEAIIHVLKAGQLHFSMLGSEERESGAFSRMIGEEWLFSEMMEHNKRVFKEHNIKRIICLSPHDYDAFISYYDNLDNIDVLHYTQLLWEMVENGDIILKKDIDKKITYHDPCYLGRQNNIYDEPRKILKSIPGIELVEMERSRETALCCGGGGTGILFDLPNINIDKVRTDQIKEVNVDCIAVACPLCYQMLASAIKSRNYEIEVKDIAQLIMEAL